MTRSIPTRVPRCGAAACSPKPLALRPRGGPPGTSCGGARLCCANVQHAWLMCTIPRQTTCPNSASTSHTKRTGRVSLSAFTTRPCTSPLTVDLARITDDAAPRRDVELSLLKPAKPPDAHILYGLHTVPGIGNLLRLVRRDDIPAIGRVPSGQDVASSARLVTCRKASAGPRVGTSGKTIGHAHRTWALSAAATLFRRHPPHGQTLLTRLENNHGQGQALPLLAHTLAWAVYDRLKRQTACDLASFLHAYRSRAGEPAVSRDTPGMRLHPPRCLSGLAASWDTQACRGPVSQSPGVCWDARSGCDTCGVCSHQVGVGGPSPEAAPHWRARHAQPACRVGREEGTT
jgi:hypothetical protein